MDILIKNMELPKEERYIELVIFPDGRIEQKHLAYGLLHLEQKAIELPPHGGLKDFNDILTIFDKVIHGVDDETNALLCDLLVQIHNAPTVLEASTEGEEET